MYIMGDTDKYLVGDVLTQLLAMSDPSDYLKIELDDVRSMLFSMEYLSTEDYLELSQLRKDKDDNK